MTLGLDQSALMLSALRPPPGMEIAAAVGTTFTLDLAALLAIPVAASFSALDEQDAERVDLLETIRRHSERTVLFCQAGAISVPTKYHAAHTFVEQTVIEVRKPPTGVFHPKWWVLRFEGGGRRIHRVLVMSRNLTFDRALDVIVRLDESAAVGPRVNSAGLVEAIRALPALAARAPSRAQRALIGGLADTLTHAPLVAPEPFTGGRFVIGTPGNFVAPFDDRCDRALAVSPYLTSDVVTAYLNSATVWSGVVSRRGALNAVRTALGSATQVLRVRDSLLDAQADAETDVHADATNRVADAVEAGPAVRGLHAKFYVQDSADTSTMWLGSANLTRPGFGMNHELLIELDGPRSRVGVHAILDPQRKRRDLSKLVENHEFPVDSDDEDEADGLAPLETLAYAIASADLTMDVRAEDDRFRLTLTAVPWDVPDGVDVRAHPLSLSNAALPMADGTAQWAELALEAVTPFVVLELRAGAERRRVLVRSTLTGDDPPHRRSAVLAHAIRSREDFLRYLAVLLGQEFAGSATASGRMGAEFGGWVGGPRADRVLEDLLTTASRNPDRLDSLDETLRQLAHDPETQDLVPDEFRAVWGSVRAAWKRTKS